MNSLSEEEIIRQVLEGHLKAFTMLVDRYRNYVFTIVLKYVENREEAEELAQDTFVKAYRFLADFKHKSKFSTWLYTITVTTCLSHVRKKKEEQKTSQVSETCEVLQSENMLRHFDRKSEKQMLEKAIENLSKPDAVIITLYYQAGQSMEELGVILGIDKNTAKLRLHRARQKLKMILTEKFPKDIADYERQSR